LKISKTKRSNLNILIELNLKRHEAFVNYGHQSQQEPVRRSHTNSHTPSKNIMLRNLLFEMTDDELSTELNMLTVPYRHIRLVKNREATHLNRGFAFIEFNTLDEAQRWMTHTQVRCPALSRL
jgi:RNA recognition motif-containing protein